MYTPRGTEGKDMTSKDNIFERGLDKRPANFQPLSPVSFLDWAASVYPKKIAVIHGPHKITWRLFAERCRRLASALATRCHMTPVCGYPCNNNKGGPVPPWTT